MYTKPVRTTAASRQRQRLSAAVGLSMSKRSQASVPDGLLSTRRLERAHEQNTVLPIRGLQAWNYGRSCGAWHSLRLQTIYELRKHESSCSSCQADRRRYEAHGPTA